MVYLAAAERDGLCDDALELGPDAPTLCAGWQVRHLVAHLLVRDGRPAALGIVVPALAGMTDRAVSRLAATDFPRLVDRLRDGPPRYSPLRLRALDRALNGLEYFVHHEDIRRARPAWRPRTLSASDQDEIWRAVRSGGRALVRRAEVGVVVARTDGPAEGTAEGTLDGIGDPPGDPPGDTVVLRQGPRPVTVAGPPAEIALFAFGRQAVAHVDLRGSDSDVATLRAASLGV